MPADIKSNLADWLVTAADNEPQPADSVVNIDDNLREIQAVVRKYLATKGADIASAATVDLAAATGQYVHVTGTTTITALGTVAAGLRYLIVFDDALTFTHDAAKLILPGAANIVTAPGDRCEVISLGAGNWRCMWYTRTSGGALNIVDGSIVTAKIADLAVTSAKLADGAVATAKIADLAVATAKIADLGVTTAKIADGAVATAKVADDAVTYAKIQNVSATDKLLGRASAGAGDIEEVVCTSFIRTLLDDADDVAARATLKVTNTIRQVVSAKIVAATGTTTIPDDDTVPVSTEGTEVAKVLITPGTTTNRVLITGCATVSHEKDTGSGAILAFFRGTTNIGAVRVDGESTTQQTVVSWAFEDVPGSTDEMSYTIRIGRVGGTVRWKINARPPDSTDITSDLGGSMILSRIVATEIVA